VPGSNVAPPGTVKPVALPPPASPPPQAQTSAGPKAIAKAPEKVQEKPQQVAKAQPSKPSVPATGIFVQAGAFSEEANARKLEQRLGDLGTVHIVPTTVNKKKLYRVRLGPVADAATANTLVGKIKSYGYNDAKVVRD
jgi:rare lipoprotein A